MSRLIIPAGMARSGSTLQHHMAVEIARRGDVLLYDYKGLARMLDDGIGTLLDAYPGDGYVIVKSHTLIDDLRPHIVDAKVLYIYRDIRDVIVSWMGFQDMSFGDIITGRVIPNLLSMWQQWRPVEKLTWRYEDVMQANMTDNVREMADYLEVELSRHHIGKVADAIGFESMNAAYPKHVRNGSVGQWKDALTRPQLGAILRQSYNGMTVAAWLRLHGYEATF